MQLRRLALALVLAGCGARASTTTLPTGAPAVRPADDLDRARSAAPKADPGSAVVKDPRVIDLDIIRIRASAPGVGSEPELTSVASTDLFNQAIEASKAGRGQEAIGRFRQLVAEFPDSQYAPLALFDVAALLDKQGDIPATIGVLRELVATYPQSRESVDGHLYIVALQADKQQWTDALATLDAVLARTNLTYGDRIEAFARQGYIQLEQQQLDAADASLDQAIAEWRKAPRLEDPYYIAMAHYYRGEVTHRRFELAPVRLPDDRLVADLEAKRVLAVQAYDRWREALSFKQPYWATAAGYQMSQIFVDLWEAHVKAPYPAHVEVVARPRYVIEVHERVREHLSKALDGHRMNVELAKAFGVETAWSRGSEQRAVQVMQLLAKDQAGDYETPAS
jgi:predicted negative regulator of RcsB-dependent stress response